MPWHPLPAAVYALVERTPAALLLESSSAACSSRACTTGGAPEPISHEPISRLFLSPLRVLIANEPQELPALFAQIETATAQGHFAAGFFTYECGNALEPKAAPKAGPKAAAQLVAHPSTAQPLAWFGIYPQSYLFDHAAGAFIDRDPPGLTPALTNTAAPASSSHPSSPPAPLELRLALTPQQYASRIDTIHEWIRAGDVYQLNFTFPLRARIAASPAALYATLRSRQPVEYGAFVHWQPGRYFLSLSPELFFRVEEQGDTRLITTRPMKGTAPRGRTTGEDRQIAEWLRTDPKNRSENVMIVDLLRNDLGRLCTYGSVRVEDLFSIERYPSLWQMTSTVIGELRPAVGYADIFRALFPCGSITGAPKVHAMELLAQIEDEPRGIYTGAIGFFSRTRTIFNVAIRTLELESNGGEDGHNAKMAVGSGIVIDSNAADEFRECQLKAEFLTRRYEPFSLVETLLWQGHYPLIELHLDRLADSANYFGFPCDRAAVKAALLAVAATFLHPAPRKIRLLVDPEGSLHIEHAVISTEPPQPARVCIASQRTDPSDPMLFHKTTHRPLYTRESKAASDAGFCDVLFLNYQGQVTEGAVCNVFIEKAGCWITPPVECGLLAGVYRRYLLETKPHIEQRILTLHDLQTANAIYLTNAVRSLRRVTLAAENHPG